MKIPVPVVANTRQKHLSSKNKENVKEPQTYFWETVVDELILSVGLHGGP